MIGEYKQGSTRRKRKQKKGPSTCSSSSCRENLKEPNGLGGNETESKSRVKQQKGDGKITGDGCR
jgi:hypothetical protein